MFWGRSIKRGVPEDVYLVARNDCGYTVCAKRCYIIRTEVDQKLHPCALRLDLCTMLTASAPQHLFGVPFRELAPSEVGLYQVYGYVSELLVQGTTTFDHNEKVFSVWFPRYGSGGNTYSGAVSGSKFLGGLGGTHPAGSVVGCAGKIVLMSDDPVRRVLTYTDLYYYSAFLKCL